MPTPLDHTARELLLLLVGSVLFAASGVILGATPIASRTWQRARLALSAHPSITRISAIFGLVALAIAGVVLMLSPPFSQAADDLSPLLSAAAFALGILGLVVGHAGEAPRSSRVAIDTNDTIGPTSATIATLNTRSAASSSNSRAA